MTTSPTPSAERIDTPQLRAELRERLEEQAQHLELAADHIADLDGVEKPRAARRLVRRLRGSADRAAAVVDDPRSTVSAFDAADLDACRALEACSAFLVRDGVRRTLTSDRFAEVGDTAILIGELAKACLGAYIDEIRSLFTGRRRIEFDTNPLHAFAPVIADGHAWARRVLTSTPDDSHRLLGHLDDAANRFCDGHVEPLAMVAPFTHMTSDALDELMSEWLDGTADELREDFDVTCDRAIAALDGARIPDASLARAFGLGVASAMVRRALDSRGRQSLDTANAFELLIALTPAEAGEDCASSMSSNVRFVR